MHELSLAQALLDTALHHPACSASSRVIRLDVKVGALAGVDVDSLTFCFALASKDTPAEGAQLRIEVTPARGRCRACGEERVLEASAARPGWSAFDPKVVSTCACGEQVFDLVGGHELMLAEMELESDEGDSPSSTR